MTTTQKHSVSSSMVEGVVTFLCKCGEKFFGPEFDRERFEFEAYTHIRLGNVYGLKPKQGKANDMNNEDNETFDSKADTAYDPTVSDGGEAVVDAPYRDGADPQVSDDADKFEPAEEVVDDDGVGEGDLVQENEPTLGTGVQRIGVVLSRNGDSVTVGHFATVETVGVDSVGKYAK